MSACGSSTKSRACKSATIFQMCISRCAALLDTSSGESSAGLEDKQILAVTVSCGLADALKRNSRSRALWPTQVCLINGGEKYENLVKSQEGSRGLSHEQLEKLSQYLHIKKTVVQPLLKLGPKAPAYQDENGRTFFSIRVSAWFST